MLVCQRAVVLTLVMAMLAGCAGLPRPESLQPILRPHDVVYRPVGEGRFPAVILLHGCGGVRSKDTRWAEAFSEQGYVALVVDSLSGRGLTSRVDRRKVCLGLDLWGSTRAGDLLASLEYIRALPFVDGTRIAVVGWSHGAWTALDFLASAPPEAVKGVRAVVAFYPYCGIASLARWRGLRVGVPLLMLLAEADSTVLTSECLELAEEETRRGHPVTTKVYPEVGHVFDWRDSAATLDARERVRAFLADRLRL